MIVAIDLDIATHYPKHLKRLYEALSDKRDIVRFFSTQVVQGNKEERDKWIAKNTEVVTSKGREHLHKLGLYCVGFVDAMFGENKEENQLLLTAYCKNHEVDLFVGRDDEACSAVKELSPETMVLHLREVV